MISNTQRADIVSAISHMLDEACEAESDYAEYFASHCGIYFDRVTGELRLVRQDDGSEKWFTINVAHGKIGSTPLFVQRSSFNLRIEPDTEIPNSDDPEQCAAIENGDLRVYSCYASVELRIPHGGDFILQYITSPGLHGIIVANTNDPYMSEVFVEQCNILVSMLDAIGVVVEDNDPVYRCPRCKSTRLCLTATAEFEFDGEDHTTGPGIEVEWDNDTETSCRDCHHEFLLEEAKSPQDATHGSDEKDEPDGFHEADFHAAMNILSCILSNGITAELRDKAENLFADCAARVPSEHDEEEEVA